MKLFRLRIEWATLPLLCFGLQAGAVSNSATSSDASPLRHDSMVIFQTKEQCEVQKPFLRDIYLQAGSSQVESWCWSIQSDRPEEYFALDVVYQGNFSLRPTSAVNPQKYSDLADCLADRDVILSDSQDMNLLGILCAPGEDRDGFEILFF